MWPLTIFSFERQTHNLISATLPLILDIEKGRETRVSFINQAIHFITIKRDLFLLLLLVCLQLKEI